MNKPRNSQALAHRIGLPIARFAALCIALLSASLPARPALADPPEGSIPGLLAFWSSGVSHARRLGEVDWSSHDLVSVVTEVNWPSTAEPFYADGPADHFALMLVGAIEIPESGIWRLGLTSDAGARLVVDGELAIDHDANHGFTRRSTQLLLTPGSHTIEIRYLEVTNTQGIVLDWQGPSMPVRATIPASAFTHQPAAASEEFVGHGLRAYWSGGMNHATTLGECDWTQYDNTSIVPNISWPITSDPFYADGPADHFSLRLAGTITLDEAGLWRFKLGSDAGARLYINGHLVINDDANHSFRFASGSISLEAGNHAFEVRYLERTNTQGLVATWQAPSASYEEVIPASAFTPGAAVPPGDTGNGLNAFWSDAVPHATVLGQVDWNTYTRQTAAAKVSWRLTTGPFQTGGPINSFALRLAGRITIPTSGVWAFKLGSDAGARLLIDNQVVINDDANHSFRFRPGTIALAAGEHDFEIFYLERTNSQGLIATWQAPGAPHEEVIPASAFSPAGLSEQTGGLGLRAYWSQGTAHATRLGQIDWSAYDHATVESQVAWEITNEPFYTDGPADHFAVRLVGLLDVPAAGGWTFRLGSDAGARLYVNGELVVNDDANHSFRFRAGSLSLPEGNVRVEIRYLERTNSQGLILTWNGPGIGHEQVIPTSAFSPDPDEPPVDAGGGALRAYWTSAINHATSLGHVDWLTYDTTSVVPKVSWRVATTPFYTGGPTDHFAARLVGTLEVPTTGTWTFALGSDAGSRLLIDGEVVVNDDANHSFRFTSGSVDLNAGPHDFEIRYMERTNSQGLIATWRGPGVVEEVIPSSALAAAPLDSPGGRFAGSAGLTALWTATRASSLNAVDWTGRAITTAMDNLNRRITTTPFYSGGPADYFAGRITGVIHIPETGEWTFRLGSDAGARLLIDGVALITDDANHSFRFTSGTATLDAGPHAFEVDYIERTNTQGLFTTWRGPAVELEEVIPAEAFAPPTNLRIVRWREVGVDEDE